MALNSELELGDRITVTMSSGRIYAMTVIRVIKPHGLGRPTKAGPWIIASSGKGLFGIGFDAVALELNSYRVERAT